MNWNKRIGEAETRGHFTASDKVDAKDWVTCACGEQDPRIPRRDRGEPENTHLSQLGCRFYYAVDSDEFNRARAVLDVIERKSAEVLAEVLQEEGHELV